MLSLDLAKAFNNISYKKLFYIFKKKGFLNIRKKNFGRVVASEN